MYMHVHSAKVKKCDDLIALRSDAYVLTEDFRIELAPDSNRNHVREANISDESRIRRKV